MTRLSLIKKTVTVERKVGRAAVLHAVRTLVMEAMHQRAEMEHRPPFGVKGGVDDVVEKVVIEVSFAG